MQTQETLNPVGFNLSKIQSSMKFEFRKAWKPNRKLS